VCRDDRKLQPAAGRTNGTLLLLAEVEFQNDGPVERVVGFAVGGPALVQKLHPSDVLPQPGADEDVVNKRVLHALASTSACGVAVVPSREYLPRVGLWKLLQDVIHPVVGLQDVQYLFGSLEII